MPTSAPRKKIGPDPGQLPTLLAIHSEIGGEIAVLRDTQFRATLYSVGLDAGLIAIFSNDTLADKVGSFEACLTTVLSSLVVVLLVVQVILTHGQLTVHRRIRRRIEATLALHEAAFYGGALALFPTRWNRPVSWRFGLATSTVPLLAVCLAFHGAMLYVLWFLIQP